MPHRRPNPLDISEEKIHEMYREMWGYAEGNHQTKMTADLLTAEMNRRLVEETTANSERWTKVSLGIAFLALSIASLSAWFSYTDWVGDIGWQNQQLQELSNLNSSVQEFRISAVGGLTALTTQLKKSEEVQSISVPEGQAGGAEPQELKRGETAHNK